MIICFMLCDNPHRGTSIKPYSVSLEIELFGQPIKMLQCEWSLPSYSVCLAGYLWTKFEKHYNNAVLFDIFVDVQIVSHGSMTTQCRPIWRRTCNRPRCPSWPRKSWRRPTPCARSRRGSRASSGHWAPPWTTPRSPSTSMSPSLYVFLTTAEP